MTHEDLAEALGTAKTQSEAFEALYRYSDAHLPVRLWTVMTVDTEENVARRAFSNRPDAYPTSGTKPIHRDVWFAQVHDRHEAFVANSIEEIAAVFPDHPTIAALGCGSCLNLPVIANGTLAATVNLLDDSEHFTPKRVAEVFEVLALPSLAAILTARTLPA